MLVPSFDVGGGIEIKMSPKLAQEFGYDDKIIDRADWVYCLTKNLHDRGFYLYPENLKDPASRDRGLLIVNDEFERLTSVDMGECNRPSVGYFDGDLPKVLRFKEGDRCTVNIDSGSCIVCFKEGDFKIIEKVGSFF